MWLYVNRCVCRWVTWDWGKGMSFFDNADAAQSGIVTRFIPVISLIEVASSQWREDEGSFCIRTAERSWDLAAEKPEDAERWIRTINADMTICREEDRSNEVFVVSLGWCIVPTAKTPELGEQTAPLQGGTIFAPQEYHPLDLSVKQTGYALHPACAFQFLRKYHKSNVSFWLLCSFTVVVFVCRFLESGHVQPSIKFSIGGVHPNEVSATWAGCLPPFSVFSEGMVPFVALYRHCLADKMLADTTGLHWSLVLPNDDPAITWCAIFH